MPGLVHDMSASGATVFIEPVSVVDANNDIKMLQSSERDEIRRILFELSGEAGNFSESIKHSYESAVQLDLIFAKAHLAYKMKASKPILNNEGITVLKKARHPLLDSKKRCLSIFRSVKSSILLLSPARTRAVKPFL